MPKKVLGRGIHTDICRCWIWLFSISWYIFPAVSYLLGSYITYDEQIYILLVGVGSEVGILAGILLAVALDI